jgi:hypothetical protein
MKRLIVTLLFCAACVAQNECPAGTTPLQTGKDANGVVHHTACVAASDGKLLLPAARIPNLNNVFYVDGVKFPATIAGIQAAINEAKAFAQAHPGDHQNNPSLQVYIPAGVYNGSVGLTLQGIVLKSDWAVLNFTSLPSTTDAITITCTGPYALADRTSIEGFFINMNNSGRDAIRIQGGNHWVLRNLRIQDYGRDGIHVMPADSNQWSENGIIENVMTRLNSSPAPGIRDAIHFELPDGLKYNFINNTFLSDINVRGYGRNAIRFTVNDAADAYAGIFDTLCLNCNTDGMKIAPPSSNAIAFERGPGVANNTINTVNFIGGGAEDTAQVHSAFAISVPSQRFVNGLHLTHFICAPTFAPPNPNLSSNCLDNPYNPSGFMMEDTSDTRNFGPTFLYGGVGISPFANLPTEVNGMMIYCNDCTLRNPPSCTNITSGPACACAGGGTGAIAKGIRGTWMCN